jgi:hypothetical protein
VLHAYRCLLPPRRLLDAATCGRSGPITLSYRMHTELLQSMEIGKASILRWLLQGETHRAGATIRLFFPLE